LVITVNDLTVGDDVNNTPNGENLATIQGTQAAPYTQNLTAVPASGGQPATVSPPILQHVYLVEDNLGVVIGETVQSVATAVIVINTPQSASAAGTAAPNPKAADPEYGSRDLQITLSRNINGVTNVIAPATVQFNAYSSTAPSPLSLDPLWYIAESGSSVYSNYDTTATFPSAYVFVPPAPPNNPLYPNITYAQDGKTPTLETLIPAVNAVLAADYTSSAAGTPTDLVHRPVPLTSQQAQRVADELTYVQGVNPLPLPSVTTSVTAGPLEDMYTAPNGSTNNSQDPSQKIYQNRVQFESALKEYYAVNDAASLQLAGYILAASAAIACEQTSLQANTTGLTVTVGVAPPPTGMVDQTFTVILTGTQYQSTSTMPPFGVPAAFFYALGANASSDADVNMRYSSATSSSESAILSTLTSALNLGILQGTETYITITPPAPPAGTPTPTPLGVINQAARKLSALGAPVAGYATAALGTNIDSIISAWLINTDTTANIGSFWISQATGTSTAAEYLNLLWLKICAEQTNLGPTIQLPLAQGGLNVQTASDLINVTDQSWTTFWASSSTTPGGTTTIENITLLPNYTAPGTSAVRVRKFINDLNMLFAVIQEPPPNPSFPSDTWPMLQSSQQDALALFFSQASGFTFSTSLSENAIQGVLKTMPISPEISNWIDDALHVISFLQAAVSANSLSTTPAAMQFSYMEALYARGFINENRVALLTRAQFQAALAGTVAYPVAVTIYDNATNNQSDPVPGQEPGDGFTPVNLGSLVNCCLLSASLNI
jgi:hypothetical protein